MNFCTLTLFWRFSFFFVILFRFSLLLLSLFLVSISLSFLDLHFLFIISSFYQHFAQIFLKLNYFSFSTSSHYSTCTTPHHFLRPSTILHALLHTIFYFLPLFYMHYSTPFSTFSHYSSCTNPHPFLLPPTILTCTYPHHFLLPPIILTFTYPRPFRSISISMYSLFSPILISPFFLPPYSPFLF